MNEPRTALRSSSHERSARTRQPRNAVVLRSLPAWPDAGIWVRVCLSRFVLLALCASLIAGGSVASAATFIVTNIIFGNGEIGIDFDLNGVTLNDANDSDTGPNNLQNFPVLTSEAASTINGTLDSTAANSGYPVRIEFFANTSCDASGHGEGQSYLGFTNLGGPGGFAFLYTPVAGQTVFTATATDSNGNTSEFSACRAESTPVELQSFEVE